MKILKIEATAVKGVYLLQVRLTEAEITQLEGAEDEAEELRYRSEKVVTNTAESFVLGESK